MLICLSMSIRRCPGCKTTDLHSVNRNWYIKTGFYRRRSDKRWIQRFKCRLCLSNFSQATQDSCFRQRKRQLNRSIFEHLASGVSQRRISYLLRINRKTVKRKFLFLGRSSLVKLRKFNLSFPLSTEIEFDDLETFEHTKCKPLSVALAVEHKSRRMLGFSVTSMPCKGRLAVKALKKYGPRADHRSMGRQLLLRSLTGVVNPQMLIKSDLNPHYPEDIRKIFPQALHIAYKGKRGAITGQGELKKVHFDPLFSLNHTCAKLRADINRLIRKTWCTTKKAECLRYHLAIYALYHNISLISRKRV